MRVVRFAATRGLFLTAAMALVPACGGSSGGGGGGGGAAATVASVSPASGPTAGGTSITVTGTGFVSGATVTVGGAGATSVNFVSATTITCATPAGAAGPADIAVTNPSASPVTLAGAFTYVAPPSISGITPSSGPASGGNAVTIDGADFGNPVASVTFGAAAAGVVSQSATQLVVTAPGGPAGPVTVTVRNPDNQTATVSYTYVAPAPTIVGMTSTDGRLVGGDTVTILGYNFGNPVASVTFGAAPATIVSQTTSSIVVTTPAGVAGPVTVTVTNSGGQTSTFGFMYAANVSPRITTTIPPDATLHAGDVRTFTVTATDPDGDLVSLRLINPPAGALFSPAAGAASPAVRELRWPVLRESGGTQHLVFQASDNQAPPHVATLTVAVRVLGDIRHSSLVVADVTGDGRLDVVAGARGADVGGVSNAGAVYVWAGSATPSGTPTATLTVPGAMAGDSLGELGLGGQGIQCADVTGDGTPDVIVGTREADRGTSTDAGAIYIWAGGAGLTGAVSPTATLAVTNPFTLDELGGWDGQGVVVADVTGEGIPDILAGRVFQLHYWRGGPGLVGNVGPSANLTGSGLGVGSTSGQTIEVADVTGDGILDVLAGDPGAGTGGRVYVWPGGPSFGTSAAKALSVPSAVANDHLGTGGGQGIQFADVTGDATLDIIVAAEDADVGGVQDTGAIYVWAGGSGLLASTGPTASLTVPGAVAFDGLVGTGWGRSLHWADVTGDGTPDVIGVAATADVGGVADVGAVYVWAGGAGMTGAYSPSATLTVAGAAANDNLGAVLAVNATGDATLDLVLSTPVADVGGVQDVGAIYVWAGGAGLTGTPAPAATLTIASAVAGDQLGDGVYGEGVQGVDVTGDSVLDVVAAAPWADVGGVMNAGAIYVWAGGAGLAGSPAPRATLTVSGAQTSDLLGAARTQGIQLADLTGDGQADVIAGASGADVGGWSNRGRIYLWAGGAGLTGSLAPGAMLTAPGSAMDEYLGDFSGSSGQGVQLAEVTGDGILDVVATTRWADVGGVQDAGALFAWAGGAGLTGTVAPTATLVVAGAQMADYLGSGAGQSVRLADLTGDGAGDVVAASSAVNPGGVQDAGVVYMWAGGGALAGTPALSATFAVPGAMAFDRLGD